MSNSNEKSDNKWILVFGAVMFGFFIIVLTMLIFFAVLLEKEVPPNSKFLIVILMSSILALSSGSLLGGYINAKGNIPITNNTPPLYFSLGGGIAVLFVSFFFGHTFYSKNPTSSENQKTTNNTQDNKKTFCDDGYNHISGHLSFNNISPPKDITKLKLTLRSDTEKKCNYSVSIDPDDYSFDTQSDDCTPKDKVKFILNNDNYQIGSNSQYQEMCRQNITLLVYYK